ncbi:GTP 3',8-cyclase MoaA [Qipengyuania soli]|uniref:GTP 3',8-cyclase n=2 Tax=Qipengyuania soli TaxID=2782568 RepID=A0A7S8F7F5_9SPHN|nr:GTP 3',8-cyclase MoaA [Qipengyuania soli]
MPKIRPANGPGGLQDSFGRRFSYLRVSLTDRCNFRCTYCLPNGYQKPADAPSELSREEFRRAVEAFARLGVWKVRLTGGEPTVRRDFSEIARDMANIAGVRRVAMTTNGYRLAREALDWRAAGVDAVNVSVDTLDPKAFAAITGHDRLAEILRGVDAAIEAQFDAVKINSVLMDGTEPGDLADILDFIRERDVSWRFIELMRTNDNAAFHLQNSRTSERLRAALVATGWTVQPKAPGAGPSIDLAHPDYRGAIGIIAPYASGFCDSCNRLRLSSRGKLHLCLFGEAGIDLRYLLQHDGQIDELVERIRSAMPHKTLGHRLHDQDSGQTPHLASIGG